MADPHGTPEPELEPEAALREAAPEQRGEGLVPGPRSVADRLAHRVRLNVPAPNNLVLAALIERLNHDDEVYALWIASNVTAVERLGMTDHGPVHVKIVMNIACKLLRLLMDAGVPPTVATTYGFGRAEAEVVVALAALFHDVGMAIHRRDHETYSLFVAQEHLRDLLRPHYDPATATILRAEILHAIIAHRAGGKPLTLEAGIVRVADALDMAKGRSRIPFAHGSASIHSISAAAIDAVRIEPGQSKPVRVRIEMTNSAGVFQLDQLLREKLMGSGLEPYVEVEAAIRGETEKRLLTAFRL